MNPPRKPPPEEIEGNLMQDVDTMQARGFILIEDGPANYYRIEAMKSRGGIHFDRDAKRRTIKCTLEPMT